jgi:hypothetical protein
MTDQIHADPSSVPPGISRRRIVKGAAWTAPVIVMASAAPAIAASPPVVTTTGIAGTGGLSTTETVNMTFNNAGGAASVLSATVTVTPTAVVGGSLTVPTSTTLATNWTNTTPTSSGTGFTTTFTRNDGIAVSPGTRTLSFQFTKSTGGNGNIAVSNVTTTPTGTNTGGIGTYA